MLTLTINGLYNYDKSIFDNFTMPTGIDKDLVIDNILIKASCFELLYPDANVLKSYIGIWCNKHFRTFSKWVTALSIQYNPLENYNRFERWTDSGKGKIKTKTVLDDTITTSSTDTNYNSAFNIDDEPYAKNGKFENTGTNKTSGKDTNTTKNEFDNIHSGSISGNIGVTTSQQMLESELQIARFNLVEQITDLFIQEFCIMVY